ncbi:class I SAM-dependent methyltransferase [Amycolatopsis sp. NPDC051045]|uniref:class I SAM-dependent DNA methyltransferase n=1 Tax=Amycolatopsis sp. NPDC051045 TaxID=3156922 RepID=UPI003445AD2B
MARDFDPWIAVRSSYDVVAGNYSALVLEDLARQPVQQGLLKAFAELARGGRVIDAGCGPGQITAHLHTLGLEVRGVDLSPGMVRQARTNFPDLDFTIGSMSELAESEGSLSGVIAWLSTIHLPEPQLQEVLAEFHRVLIDGAPVLLTFQVGDGVKHFTQQWGSEVDLVVHRRRPEAVEAMLVSAGFHVVLTSVFEPAGRRGAQAACLIALRE